MNEDEIVRHHAFALKVAAGHRIIDKAVEPADLVQRAWQRVYRIMETLPTELDRLKYLLRAVSNAGIDEHRRYMHRPEGPRRTPTLPLPPTVPGHHNTAQEVHERLEVDAVIDQHLAGDIFATAALFLALGDGNTASAALKTSRTTVATRAHRYRKRNTRDNL
jgi:DNA-directed RNA polymerase specialized sigma24 family protein